MFAQLLAHLVHVEFGQRSNGRVGVLFDKRGQILRRLSVAIVNVVPVVLHGHISQNGRRRLEQNVSGIFGQLILGAHFNGDG